MYRDVRVEVPWVNWAVMIWMISRLGIEHICSIHSPLCTVGADQDRLE